jgi:hypothetical protein
LQLIATVDNERGNGMRKSAAHLTTLMILLAIAYMPSCAYGASWEVGWTYIPDITSRDLTQWEYFGQRVSAGIVEFVTPTMQLGGYASYGRYRYTRYGVFDPDKLPSWRSRRSLDSESAVDLGVILRAIPPPTTQRVREFLFFSYAVRIMEAHNWRAAFDKIHLFSLGFGAVVRLAEGTRIVVQAGPAFDWDMSYGELPMSVMLQYGSP